MIHIKKILIVEDEFGYVQLLNEQLSTEGYTVIKASDGEKGLSLAKSQQPDLILLDIRLPVMDGMKMLAALRKNAYGKSVKVIILTNLEPDDELIRKTIQGRPSYYLIKSDIQLSELLDKIKEVLAD